GALPAAAFGSYSPGHHRPLASVPTRRSSDLAEHAGSRLGDAGHGGEHGLDLAEFDALAAELHLEVGAAEIDQFGGVAAGLPAHQDRKSTRLNSSHVKISYAVFCLKKKRPPAA